MTIDKSILFALASLLFAGINDLVFKKQASGGGGRGQYMAIVGIVWMLVFAAIAYFCQHAVLTFAAVKWGIIAGLFSVSANYLLIWSFRSLDASVGATIYRLNMLAAAVIAILFLNETLTTEKIAGLLTGLFAIFLFVEPPQKTSRRFTINAALLLALSASLLRALMGIAYKLAANDFAKLDLAATGSQQEWFLAIQGLIWLIVGLFCAWRFESSIRLTGQNISYGILSGLLICGIVLFFAKALAIGQASIIIPIAQMSFLVTALISWPVMKERFSPRKITGLALSAVAILLLSQSS